jgi:hypothetical protein
MKITRFFLAILTLFTASCNPDEDLNDGSNNNGSGNGGSSGNTNNMSFDEAIQTIQGTWYLSEIEKWRNGFCIGEETFCYSNNYNDLNYTRWKLDFTQAAFSPNGLSSTLNLVGMYGDSLCSPVYSYFMQGNNTPFGYRFYRGILDPMVVPNLVQGNSSDLRISLDYNGVISDLDGLYKAYKIVELNDQEMILECAAYGFTNCEGNIVSCTSRYKFKKQNISETPNLNSNLIGRFQPSHFKYVLDGVTQIDSNAGPNSTIIEFTDSIVSYNNISSTPSMCKALIGRGGEFTYQTNQGTPPTPQLYDIVYFYQSGPNEFYYSADSSEILFDYSGQSLRIMSLTTTDLVLRFYCGCNTYYEYTFYRV